MSKQIVLGSGTAETSDTLIVAEYVLVTEPEPPGANAPKTVWKGTVNCEVNMPDQLSRPSAETPETSQVAVDCERGSLKKSKAEGKPGRLGVQSCPAAGGDAAHPAEPSIPAEIKLMSRGDKVGLASKLRNSVGTKAVPTGSVATLRSSIVAVVPPKAE
jgi:hypothetical protein